MRRSAEEKAETRRQIVRTAGRMIRGRGLANTGVAELMAEAGLTHGGFYRHFASKDEMAAAAVTTAMTAIRGRLVAIAQAAPPGRKLAAVVDEYLTEAHRDRPERGCVVAAIGAEVTRSGGAVTEAYAENTALLIDLYATLIKAPNKRQAKDRAEAMLAILVGGLLLGRALKDPAESKRALKNARDAALTLAVSL